MARPVAALLLAVLLLGPRPSLAASFATPLKVDSMELAGAGVDDYVVGGDVYCGNSSSPGDGFLYIEDTDPNVDYGCPGNEQYLMVNIGGPFHGYTAAGGHAIVTFADVAPAEGESVGVSFVTFADAYFTPGDFIRFEVRNVGGQLYYGAVDETGEVGFTNTLDFENTLVLDLTAFALGVPAFGYAVDGGAFVDVTAELSAVDGLTSFGNYLALEAFIVPEPARLALLLAALGLAAYRQRP